MIAFSLGSLDVYRYGIFYFIAFLLGYLFLYRIPKKNIFGKDFPRLQVFLKNNLDDLMICIFLGVLVGGRLGHVIIYNFQYYLAHPVEIFQVRKGGMSFIGGMIGVAISFAVLAWKKKFRFKELVVLFDLIVSILPFGIMLGRLGNYLNQELYGIVVSKSLGNLSQPILSFLYKLHILHIYEQVDLQLRVNTNFLASFFEGFVLLLITMSIISKRVRTKVIQPGKIVAVFLVAYSFVRFCLEYVRADSQLEFHGRFTISQRFFILFFILGRGIGLWSYFQKKS